MVLPIRIAKKGTNRINRYGSKGQADMKADHSLIERTKVNFAILMV